MYQISEEAFASIFRVELSLLHSDYIFIADFSETMVAVYQTVRRHSHGLECLKSVSVFSTVL